MLMRDGTLVPKILLQSLEKDSYALRVFISMSETYQKLFVMQVTNPQKGDSMRERVEQTIKDIHKYGESNEL